MDCAKGISRIFVHSLAPVVQINLGATVEIDTFHERASAPAPRISRFFHPNDESWGGVVRVGVDIVILSYWFLCMPGSRSYPFCLILDNVMQLRNILLILCRKNVCGVRNVGCLAQCIYHTWNTMGYSVADLSSQDFCTVQKYLFCDVHHLVLRAHTMPRHAYAVSNTTQNLLHWLASYLGSLSETLFAFVWGSPWWTVCKNGMNCNQLSAT